jgi:hypothetical protein
MGQAERGSVVVCQPDQGESFWQPVPANGYSVVRVSKGFVRLTPIRLNL